MLKDFANRLVKGNPVFMLLVGLCPALIVTARFSDALALGLALTVVLMGTNLTVSLLKNILPSKARLFGVLLVSAALATVIDLFLQTCLPDLSQRLGIFVPLIAVNCLVLSRAEDFAAKNGALASVLDGLGMGFGFTLALGLIALLREPLGAGSLSLLPLSVPGLPEGKAAIPGLSDAPLAVIAAPAGGFLAVGFLLGLFNSRGAIKKRFKQWGASLALLVSKGREKKKEQEPRP